MVTTNLSLVPTNSSSNSAPSSIQGSQPKRQKTESSSTQSIVDRLPAPVIRQIAGFVPEDSSFPFIRLCKAFYRDVNLVAATFDLSCKTTLAKTVNTFFQRRLNDSLPFTLPRILQNPRVLQSVRHFEISFPTVPAVANGSNLAQILQTFSRLQTLSITDWCNISAEGFQALENCAELRTLKYIDYFNDDARSNQYIQNSPSLAKIPNLEELDLMSHSALSRAVMPHLSTFTKLRVLLLHDDGPETDLECITKLPNLQTFAFYSGFGITQAALEQIASCKSITDCSLLFFTDDAKLEHLRNMTQLEKLRVWCPYQDIPLETPFAHLQKLYNVKELALSTKSLKAINKMPSLEKLVLLCGDNVDCIDDDCIDELIKCEKLKEVVLITVPKWLCSKAKLSKIEKAIEKLQKTKPNLKISQTTLKNS